MRWLPTFIPASPRRRVLALGLALGCATLAHGGVAAQVAASPEDLHDCTRLTDPGRLQQCILREQGGRKIRGRLSSGSKAPDAPIFRDAESPDATLAPLPPGPP